MRTYYGNQFKNKDDIIKEFLIDESALDNCVILFAFYEYVDYSGTCFVLFMQNGSLYEVNGHHCSCDGLSGEQWDPEPTHKDALKMRKFYFEDKEAEVALKNIIDLLPG